MDPNPESLLLDVSAHQNVWMRMYSTPTNMKTIFIEICNIAPCRQQELLLCGHSFQGMLEQI
jgi:hypothetical protein